MRGISDDFLLNMASVSATLIGLFLVGIFFYMEGGIRRWGQARSSFEPYLRAGTKITLIVFAIPTFLPLILVALDLFWARVLFVLLSIMLLTANVETVVLILRMTAVAKSRVFLVHELVTTSMALALVTLPWILGGFHPTREDLTWSILLAFAAGFLSIGATVMSVFDASQVKSTRAKTSNQK